VNNSFVTDYIPCISIESNCFTNSTITVKNNAFYDIHTGSGNNFCVYTYTTDPLSNVTFDYNIYKSFNTASAEFFDWANGIGEGGLTIMQSHSWETHGLNADSKFSTVATQATASLADLHLTLGSPAVQAGANLSSLGFPGLTSDKDGNARSTSGAWDIGAYKYTGTVTTVAPSNAVTKITSP
jgi:PKD repeat protein